MSRAKYLAGGIAAILVGLVAYSSLFQVSETQQAIILQFGDPRRVASEPGLNYKHFWQSVRFYEKRVLSLDPPVETMVLLDQKRVMVDSNKAGFWRLGHVPLRKRRLPESSSRGADSACQRRCDGSPDGIFFCLSLVPFRKILQFQP